MQAEMDRLIQRGIRELTDLIDEMVGNDIAEIWHLATEDEIRAIARRCYEMYHAELWAMYCGCEDTGCKTTH
jgi:hypothetical protein